MLVLGKKYKFTKFELARLKKQFKNISILASSNRAAEDIIKELKEHIEIYGPSLLLLNTRTRVDDKIVQFLTELQFESKKNRFSIMGMSHFMEKYLHKCHIPESNFNLYFLEDIKPYTNWQYFQKRCIDYFGLFLLFFFSWPVMVWCVYKIKKESPGKSLFVQERIGLKNKPFKCYKFRTMHENSEHNPYTQEGDSRIFPFGHFMRKARFDELPQMWNILKGDMHLIGPRAEWNILVEEYETSLPYYNERHLVHPGITGWAQVNYPYGQNLHDTHQKLMYDLYYIKNWSLVLELKIVWMTAMTVIKRKGL